MKKVIKHVFYIKGKPNILLIIVSGFIGMFLLTLLVIFSLKIILKDSIHYSDRFNEQIRNHEYLKKNIDFFFPYGHTIIDEVKDSCQIYRVIDLELGGGKHAIIDVWHKTEEFDWEFDSVKILEKSDKFIRHYKKYKFDRR